MSYQEPAGVVVLGKYTPAFASILTRDALQFLAELERHFGSRREELLANREQRQRELDGGVFPAFLERTQWIRDGDWVGPSIPADLADRRVEITGPPDRKMMINALNCGAKVFMVDFEDAHSPTWENCIQGQINCRDSIRGTISLRSKGKLYRLNDEIATLMQRPRGWHLTEHHILVDGKPMSGSLADFGLYFYHNAKRLLENGSGPYFYFPKLETHLEARLWNDVMVFAQNRLGIPRGTCRATVLIETITAVFEMDEILYELREHSAGLNCGRWDYIFSCIKKFRNHPEFTFPDRGQVGMDRPFMAAYVRLLIKTCHRRKVHAMGGMAAQIPIKGDKAANDAVLNKVRQDKIREAKAGHDGTWVAHPGLIRVAFDVFNEYMPTPNQIESVPRHDVSVSSKELLPMNVTGTITKRGLESNIEVGLKYLEAWLRGNGCVPIHNLMEDAATAEISRSQVWQWVHNDAKLDDGTPISRLLVMRTLVQITDSIKAEIGEEAFAKSRFPLAGELFAKLLLDDSFVEFLTLIAEPFIVERVAQKRSAL